MKKDRRDLEILLADDLIEAQDRLPIILLALSLGLALAWVFLSH